MNDSHDETRRMSLFCQRGDDCWMVVVGPPWLPERLRPFVDENFETGNLLLDFEYLEDLVQRRGATCAIKETTAGDMEVSASGDSARVLASWLGTALASGLQPTRK